jgi:hypothetical protein
MSVFSAPARLLVSPFRGYAELANADQAEGRPTLAGGMMRFLFVLGAFVSVTATGRFAPFELVSGIISFAYVPVLHATAVAIAVRVVAPEIRFARAFALYAEGYGPWFLFMLAIAGGSLFAPDPARLLAATIGWMIAVAHCWGAVLTYACFRSGLALSRRRAASATAIHFVVVACLILGFFLAAGQLLPIIPR